MTVVGIHVVGLMMLIRVHALYWDKRWVVVALGTLWIIMFSIQAWVLSKGQSVMYNPASGVRACTMAFASSLRDIASSSAWLPLLYDSCVLILTLLKTVPEAFKGRMITMRVFQDGVIYYLAILTVNVVIISTGPSDALPTVTSSWTAFAQYGRLELL
ncbi:hypothetical protein C8R45DRAFT_1105884 [Mycena sanguinolenta]|nr:hypothetical protein C8R45DRAFT_1105884 [Mycena sanguinolenta]